MLSSNNTRYVTVVVYDNLLLTNSRPFVYAGLCNISACDSKWFSFCSTFDVVHYDF